MRAFTKWVPFFILSVFILGACNNKNEVTDTAQQVASPSQDLAGDGKSLVAGCTGSGYTYSGSVDALKAGNFAEADRQASCVFNASVKLDAKHPDLKAANIAFISKVILVIEAPQMRDLLMAPDLKANDILGPSGDLKKADAVLENIYGTSKGYEKAYKFFKAHEDKGQSPQAVFELAISLVRERGTDLHILAKAMAADANFSDILPKYLVNVPDAKDYTIAQPDVAALDFDISMLRFLAEVLQHYNLGLTSASSLTGVSDQAIAVKLASDLNTDARLLQLKAPSDGMSALPVFEELLNSAQVALSVLSQKEVQDWAKDFPDMFNLPTMGKTEDQKNWELSVFQVRQSLESGDWVQLTAFDDHVTKVNAKAFFTKLPDSKEVSVNIVEVDDDDVEMSDDFLKPFVKDFLTEE